MYDLQGKLLAEEKPALYSGASSMMTLFSTANLKNGMYILRISAGNEQLVYKVLKQ